MTYTPHTIQYLEIVLLICEQLLGNTATAMRAIKRLTQDICKRRMWKNWSDITGCEHCLTRSALYSLLNPTCRPPSAILEAADVYRKYLLGM